MESQKNLSNRLGFFTFYGLLKKPVLRPNVFLYDLVRAQILQIKYNEMQEKCHSSLR